jgi:hypothetical protein
MHAPYSLLLISNKLWMRRGKVGSWRGRSQGAELQGENKRFEGMEVLLHWRVWWGWGSSAVK